MKQTFVLPFPPSANRLWRNVNGKTLKSKEYRLWEEEAGMMLRLANPKSVASPAGVRIVIHGGKGFSRARDADNRMSSWVNQRRSAMAASSRKAEQ